MGVNATLKAFTENDSEFRTELIKRLAKSSYVPNLTQEEFQSMIGAVVDVFHIVVLRWVANEYRE